MTWQGIIIAAAQQGVPPWLIAKDIGRSRGYVGVVLWKARRQGFIIPSFPKGAPKKRQRI